jgi:hypothetical protein
VNRLCKVLEDAGLKLTTVLSDVMGASGRAMIEALVAGTTDPTILAGAALSKDRLAAVCATVDRVFGHMSALGDDLWGRLSGEPP